jgi:phosphoglycerate dehydrogenase-like enzyme
MLYQYFIATTLILFHRLQEQIVAGQVDKRWMPADEVGGRMFIRELRGQTVGVLGYGHIGRESARLAHAFGANVIAATSDGVRKPQDGYIIPGTGDPDGR